MSDWKTSDGITSKGVDLNIPDIFVTDRKEVVEAKINGYIEEALMRLEEFKDPSLVDEDEYAPHVNVRIAIDADRVPQQGRLELHERLTNVLNYTLAVLPHHNARLVGLDFYSAFRSHQNGHILFGFNIRITPEEEYGRVTQVITDGFTKLELSPWMDGFNSQSVH